MRPCRAIKPCLSVILVSRGNSRKMPSATQEQAGVANANAYKLMGSLSDFICCTLGWVSMLFEVYTVYNWSNLVNRVQITCLCER